MASFGTGDAGTTTVTAGVCVLSEMRLLTAPGTTDGAALEAVRDRPLIREVGKETVVGIVAEPRGFGERVETGLPLVGVGGLANCWVRGG